MRYLVLLLAMSVFPAYAADYAWHQSGFPTPTYSSAGSACSEIAASKETATYTYSVRALVKNSETSFSCGHTRTNKNTGVSSDQAMFGISRTGDSCPADYTYVPDDPNGDQCKAPAPSPCMASYGQTKDFTISGNQSDPGAFYQPVNGSKYWSNPNTVVLGGCSATVNPGTNCLVYGNGDYTCVGTANYDGTVGDPSAGENGSEECSEEDCPDTDPTPTAEQSNECTNWVYDAEGRRTRSCQTKSDAKQPGRAACLTNGALVCVNPSPTPESDSKVRDDTIKETDNADGGKTTETTSTTNKTYCTNGACSTTTTTNNSTTVTNGNGEVTSETGTCVGDDCAKPKTEEEEKGEAPEQAELPQVGEEDDPSYGESLSNFTSRVQGSPLISAVSSIAFPSGGGSCSMGSVSLWGGSISFDSFCSMAAPVLGGLRYLFLSIWAIAAVRLFMTA